MIDIDPNAIVIFPEGWLLLPPVWREGAKCIIGNKDEHWDELDAETLEIRIQTYGRYN